MPQRLAIEVEARPPGGRWAPAGVLRTSRGDISTPAFMPVGTHGAVNAMLPKELEAVGAEIIVCNAFHLARAPGARCCAAMRACTSSWAGRARS